MIITAIITIIGAYLIGSVNFAVIFTKIFTKSDVRSIGSGNAGATNALRAGGVVPGLLTFLCDTIKGFLSALIGYYMFDYIFSSTANAAYLPVYGAYLCAVACVLGHIFPLFFDFKGGKGVAVGLGVFCMCSYKAAIIGLIVFIILFVVSKIVSLSSICASLAVVVGSMIFYNDSAKFLPQMIFALLIGSIIIVKHKSNIVRLINGEENKLNIKR